MRKHLHTVLILVLGIAIYGTLPFTATSAPLSFAERSPLASGHWVKISTPSTGIYELSYDLLRSLGFSQPEKVKVWGEGGVMYPMNFINGTTGNREIPDTMCQVAAMHSNNKLYFYGKGVDNLQWTFTNTFEIPGRFANTGRNIYSNAGVYFLSDKGKEKPVQLCEQTPGNLSPTQSAYAHYYHEKDITQGTSHSGQNFWGESFLSTSDRIQTFSYVAPGVKEGSSAVINVRFNALAWLPSKINIKMDGGEALTSNFDARPESGYIVEITNDLQNFDIPAPHENGTVEISWLPPNCDLTDARLDYIILTYERNLDFATDENQFAVQTMVQENRPLAAPTGSDVACWDVTNPAAAIALKSVNGLIAASAGSRNLVFFKQNQQQLTPVVQGLVPNSDLRGRMLTANPEYIIITTPEFKARAQQLANFHILNDNLKVEVVTIDEIYNDFSAGRPDPMAYRSMLRMLYERSGSHLRGVLLYGPQRSDVRGTNAEQKRDAIIVYQNPNSSHISSCIAFTDLYGIFSNTLAKYISTEQMSIAVASLPVVSDAEAERYYNKVVQYYYDQSFPYWMERMLYTADDKNIGAHMRQAEELAAEVSQLNDSSLVIDKVYFGEYGHPAVKRPMYNAFIEGAPYALYVGHGSPLQIGFDAPFINPSDIGNFTNNRLSFMSFASCETTLYEVGNRGVSEHMILSTEGGLIGVFGTVRTAFSGDNYGCMRTLNKMMMQLPAAANGRPTEFGELIRRTKNGVAGYEGKYKFHLMVDPMLRLMLPTMKMKLSATPHTATPGQKAKFTGNITTPQGTAEGNFNGTLVLKWYAPEWKTKNHSKVANEPDPDLYVSYNHEVAAIQVFDVNNGRFSIDEDVPELMRRYAGNEVRVTLTAYDAEQRLGATWSGKTYIDPSSSETPSTDTQPPVILAMQAEGATSTTLLPPDFTLQIDASDNIGIRIDEKALDTPLSLIIDNKPVHAGITSYATMTDGAKKLSIRYPMRSMNVGRHRAEIILTDFAGNISRSEYIFEVGSGANTEAPLLNQTACKTIATFSWQIGNDAQLQDAVLVITDALGKEIITMPWQNDDCSWDLKDTAGNRVPAGLYKAGIRFIDANGRSAVTKATYVPVLTN